MEEQASFETRAVLAPRRARLTRLALLVPVVVLFAAAWAGISGPRSGPARADDPGAVELAAASRSVVGDASPSRAPATTPRPRPAEVLGLHVQRLDDLQRHEGGRDDMVVVTGWYVATAMSDCPAVGVINRDGSLPEIRPDLDALTFCDRYGLLYASHPVLDGRNSAGFPAVAVTLLSGVVAPNELETIGAAATEVVVIGRFVPSGDGCDVEGACRERLVVDHVAWTPGA